MCWFASNVVAIVGNRGKGDTFLTVTCWDESSLGGFMSDIAVVAGSGYDTLGIGVAMLVIAVCAMVGSHINVGGITLDVVAVDGFGVTWAAASAWHLYVGAIRLHWFASNVVLVVGSKGDVVITFTQWDA